MDNNSNEVIEKVAAYQTLFNGASAQVVLDDLADRAGIYHTATDLSGNQLAYNEGARMMYLYIKSLVDADLSELKDEKE